MRKNIIFAAVILSLISAVSVNAKSKPFTGWEQEVNYNLDITLYPDLRTIDGMIDIQYINNSPDKLPELYLKAFPNAIQKDSYADKKQRKMNDYSFAILKPEQEGSMELIEIPARKNYEYFETDNSIIRVKLFSPILPGDTFHLVFRFKTVLPSPANMRMGYDNGVTRAAYWYPQVCVYDRKVGWVNSQYLGWGECYGDLGTFDVKITVPEDQIVAATGVCVNETEVLPDSLYQLYHISNFTKPREVWPIFNFDKNKQKTWHYLAENTNDFVFSCSNNWCIDVDVVNDVKVVAYPLRYKAGGWQDAVRLGKEAVITFSELFYPYQWPVVRICDAFGGMEYPMLTNCSGDASSPSFSMLLYHEIGHFWFMGQIGSNQVDRPFLDEGFTTHMEHVVMEKYYGRKGNFNRFRTAFERKFSPDYEDRNVRGFRPLMQLLMQEYDKPMSFSYDQGEEYWPYRVSAYYKSAAMHYSLRSILGDSLYFRAMQSYCERWVFHHPYEEDFTQAMEDASGLELDNFLQQWYYSKKRLDYAYAGKKKEKEKQKRDYKHTVKIENKGEFVSPVDVAVVWEQGDTTFYTIAPEGMQFAKPGYILLPSWEQFRRLNNEYEFTVKAERNIKEVVVDPFNLLMDINRFNNNSSLLPPIELHLDNMKYDRPAVNEYTLRWRPDIWYNDLSGVQLGLHSHGSYLDVDHKFSADFRIGTDDGRISTDLIYKHLFRPFGRDAYTFWRLLSADKRVFFSNAYEKKFKKFYLRDDYEYLRLEINLMDMGGSVYDRFEPNSENNTKYLLDPHWDANSVVYLKFYTEVKREFRYGYYFFKSTEIIGKYGNSGRYLGYDMMNHRGGLVLTRKSKPCFDIKIGYQAFSGEPPAQFLPHLSRLSSAEQFLNSKLFRSPGTYPADWSDNFYASSDGVRGYQDRTIYFTESMNSSLSLTPPDLLPYKWFKQLPFIGKFLSKIDNSFFVDMAYITMDDKEKYYPIIDTFNESLLFENESELYLSAGVSITMPPIWSEHYLRLDFPFYLNKPAVGGDNFEFRFSVAMLLPEIK